MAQPLSNLADLLDAFGQEGFAASPGKAVFSIGRGDAVTDKVDCGHLL
jgi:hypothetical protein